MSVKLLANMVTRIIVPGLAMNHVVNIFLLMAIALILVVMKILHQAEINAKRLAVLMSIKMELRRYA